MKEIFKSNYLKSGAQNSFSSSKKPITGLFIWLGLNTVLFGCRIQRMTVLFSSYKVAYSLPHFFSAVLYLL